MHTNYGHYASTTAFRFPIIDLINCSHIECEKKFQWLCCFYFACKDFYLCQIFIFIYQIRDQFRTKQNQTLHSDQVNIKIIISDNLKNLAK